MYNVEIQRKGYLISFFILEVDIMNNVIEITPDRNGKLFITLYGTRYEIKIKTSKTKKDGE